MSLGTLFQPGIAQTVIAQAVQQGTIQSAPLYPPCGMSSCLVTLVGNNSDVLLGLGTTGAIKLFQYAGRLVAACEWGACMQTLSRVDNMTIQRPGFMISPLPASAWFFVELDLNSPMNAGLQVVFS